MHKKVKFSTLQRFDLKDANELQQGIDGKVSTLSSALSPWGLSSLRRGGPLDKVSVQGVSNGIVTFGPMKLVTSETDDVIEMTQDDVDNGLTQIDISAIYNSYVTQVNQGIGLTGIYFYAYPVTEDTDVEVRNFYNVIDDAVESRSVATRSQTKASITANLASSFFLPDVSGNRPIYLGHVDADDISLTNSNSPFNPTNFKSYNHFSPLYGDDSDWDDTALPNAGERVDFPGTDNLTDGNSFSALSLVFKRLERQLNRIVSYGSADPSGTLVLPLNLKPQFSLQGLNQKLVELIALQSNERSALDDKHSVANITYFFNRSSGLGSYSFASVDDENDFVVYGRLDFDLARNEFSQTTANIENWVSDEAKQHTYSSLVIVLPSALIDKKIKRVDVSTVSATGTITNLSRSNISSIRYSKTGDSSTWENFNYVKNETYVDDDGTSIEVPAILIKLDPLSTFTDDDVRFGVNISITVDTRS